MSEEVREKIRGVSAATATGTAAADQSSSLPPNYYYGTFQGVANYQPKPPPPKCSVMGFPQPVPPPAISGPQLPPAVSVPQPHQYPLGYHTVPGYIVDHGVPVREERLPCFGVGLGWFLFIIGFFFGAVPWYIGAFLLVFVRMDYREKPGLVACTIAGVLAALFLFYFK